MTNFLNSIPYEILVFFTVIIIAIIIWGFFKMKKENPNDVCSRVVILPIIPAMIACTLKRYCNQKSVNTVLNTFSNVFFWLSCAAIIITIAVALFISYKQKGEYYERIKSNKSILIFCGVGAIICALVVLYAKFFM
jgi:uncharacterized membrane protein (DUF373 family)